MPPAILVTCRIAEDIVQRLKQHAPVIEGADRDQGMPRAEALRHIGDVAAVLNQNELKIDAELLGRAPHLRIVANATSGFDNMNVAEMRRHNVWGTNTPTSFAIDTANHTIGLLLCLTRRMLEADRYVRSGNWRNEGWKPGGRWDGTALTGKHLGIIGYGNIGRHVATRARAFGMQVAFHNRSGEGDADWLPLDVLLAKSDVVSVHCPLNENTRHLLDARALALMKRGAILLNLARGPVVAIDPLVAALQSGHLGGAGLDVFEFEPDVPASLIAMENVVLTPHMAGCTVESRRSALVLSADNIISVLSGESPMTPVFALA